MMKKDVAASDLPSWRKLECTAKPQLDDRGESFLEVPMDGTTVGVGLCRANALRVSGPPELVQNLLLTRLEFELKRTKPTRASAIEIRNDWKLLRDARGRSRAALN
jgi:hypothetical protein